MRLRFGLGRRYGWPWYRCIAFALWGGERMLSDGRPLNVLEQFERRFPGRCAICSYHRYGVTHGHVDGWLVTHTEPGLTLGDVRRLVNANATGAKVR